MHNNVFNDGFIDFFKLIRVGCSIQSKGLIKSDYGWLTGFLRWMLYMIFFEAFCIKCDKYNFEIASKIQ